MCSGQSRTALMFLEQDKVVNKSHNYLEPDDTEYDQSNDRVVGVQAVCDSSHPYAHPHRCSENNGRESLNGSMEPDGVRAGHHAHQHGSQREEDDPGYAGKHGVGNNDSVIIRRRSIAATIVARAPVTAGVLSV